MKQITIDKKVYVLDYTFNSIRYMDNLNFNELQNIEETPFKFYTFTAKLFHGALNWNSKKFFSEDEAYALLEKYFEENPDKSKTLIEDLLNMLQESNFFKNLQD